MIPYLLAVFGGYLVAQSRKSETFADGGVATEPMVVSFGKHNGKTISQIFEVDRGWVKWFVEKYKTEPYIDFRGNSRMPQLTEQDIAMKEQARELLAKNPEKTRDKSTSNYIGRIGDRVSILATVVHIGPSTIFFKDERGNIFYIYDKSFDVSGKEGEMFKVTGTVTKQWEKAGEKVTYLNRPKVERYKKPADWMYMEDGGYIKQNKDLGDDIVELRYKVDYDEQSIEVDETTKEYLVELGIVRASMIRKLRNSYIFWYDELLPTELAELEEFLEDSFILKNWYERYSEDPDPEERPDDDYKKGGKVKKRAKFVDKVDSIADRLDGQKVPKKLQKDYGKRYNRAEAEEAGRRIAGAQLKKLKE